jgi:hypothetical protein
MVLVALYAVTIPQSFLLHIKSRLPNIETDSNNKKSKTPTASTGRGHHHKEYRVNYRRDEIQSSE